MRGTGEPDRLGGGDGGRAHSPPCPEQIDSRIEITGEARDVLLVAVAPIERWADRKRYPGWCQCLADPVGGGGVGGRQIGEGLDVCGML